MRTSTARRAGAPGSCTASCPPDSSQSPWPMRTLSLRTSPPCAIRARSARAATAAGASTGLGLMPTTSPAGGGDRSALLPCRNRVDLLLPCRDKAVGSDPRLPERKGSKLSLADMCSGTARRVEIP
eukprot:7033030-Prymnesium_polylepis.1